MIISKGTVTEKLATFSASHRCPLSSKIPWSNFIPNFRICTNNLWLKHWESFFLHFATWYRAIFPTISPLSWFQNLNLSRKSIASFSRLRFGHILLPSYSFKLSLNDSSFCILHNDPMVCDITHLIFICPSLLPRSDHLLSLFNSYNIFFNTKNILSNQQKNIILNILSFFNHTGFLI